MYAFDEVHKRWTRYADCTYSMGCDSSEGFACTSSDDARQICGSEGAYTAGNMFRDKVWYGKSRV